MNLSLGPDPKLTFSPLCRSLIVMNAGVYLLGLAGDLLKWTSVSSASLLNTFALFPSAVVNEGMFWTPLTYMFLHANLIHLLVNMMGLYLLGPDLEQALGKVRFSLLYGLSGWLGGIGFVGISYFLQGKLHPCVGASGAIFGLLGGIVALYPKRIYVILPLMIPMRASVLAVILLSTHLFFIVTPYGSNVAYDVHLTGGLTGFMVSGGTALLHRFRWRDVIPRPEIPYVCVEMETLAYRIAEKGPREVSPEEHQRYEFLKNVLRYEDVPSVEEIRAHSRS
ncbi:MAG: rhomboid family intramembrane serine protease [Kiritimatiellia bacterium]